jgi:PAS domain S-box-containing protein
VGRSQTRGPVAAAVDTFARPPSPTAVAVHGVDFERLLTELSVGFVGVTAGDISAAIRDALERIVSLLGLDVGAVMEVAADAQSVLLTHSYVRPGVTLEALDSPTDRFPWIASRLFAGEVTRLATLDDLPATATEDRRSLEQRDVRSAVFCPVVAGGVTGAVAFACVGRERSWPNELVDRLCLTGQLFAGALARRELEERLSDEREFVEAVLDSLPGLFYVADESNRFVRWNKNTELVTGCSGGELRRHDLYTFVAPEDKPAVEAAIETVWRTGAATTRNVVVTSDGRHVPYFATARIVTLGGRRYVVGLEVDISALHAAEEQIRRQQAELAHVARVSAMGELAAAIAHELNQPLTAIRTNAQATRRMLAKGAVPAAELDEALTDITDDAVRAGEIIRRLRDLLRKGDAERLPLDVNELIRAVEPFARADVLEHNVTLAMNLPRALPRVLGDRIQLQQVVLNLIRNASEAMRAAEPTRRDLVVVTALAGHEIEVTVTDRGPALSDEAFGRMFTPFHTTKPGGLGIGLSLSRSIVEAHGGLLWATRNESESGITMHFTLPCEPTVAA